MFGSDILDVAIGLVLVFLLVSLLTTAAKEMLEAWLKTRARELERGIRTMLADPDGQGVARQFFGHALIDSLFPGDYRPEQLTGGSKAKGPYMPLGDRVGLPSYIPAGHFAGALIDIVMRGPPVPGATGAPEVKLPYPVLAAMTAEALRAAAARFPNEHVRTAITTALDAAKDDMSAARANLEAWYDGVMDRVSGQFKRRSQWVLLALGIGIAGMFNIDAIEIGHSLSVNKALRDSVVAQATQITKAVADGQPADATALASLQKESFEGLRVRLQGLGLPIGWPLPQFAEGRGVSTWLGVPLLIIGWAITGLAASLGAPFWFDLLNRFMIIRSTVKPDQKSGNQAPAEPQAKEEKPDGQARAVAAAPAPPVPRLPPAPADFVAHEWDPGHNDDPQAGVI